MSRSDYIAWVRPRFDDNHRRSASGIGFFTFPSTDALFNNFVDNSGLIKFDEKNYRTSRKYLESLTSRKANKETKAKFNRVRQAIQQNLSRAFKDLTGKKKHQQ
jgi:hypothetical protein